jgi:hypothetical protein
MQIPGSASDPIEAYDLLSAVASELYADGIHRYGKG